MNPVLHCREILFAKYDCEYGSRLKSGLKGSDTGLVGGNGDLVALDVQSTVVWTGHQIMLRLLHLFNLIYQIPMAVVCGPRIPFPGNNPNTLDINVEDIRREIADAILWLKKGSTSWVLYALDLSVISFGGVTWLRFSRYFIWGSMRDLSSGIRRCYTL